MIEHLPALKIELEGIKQSISLMFNQNNAALNKMVQQTIESRLTEEWVQKEINIAVDFCIKNAIKEVSSSWKLQAAISSLISDSLEKIIDKAAAHPQPVDENRE